MPASSQGRQACWACSQLLLLQRLCLCGATGGASGSGGGGSHGDGDGARPDEDSCRQLAAASSRPLHSVAVSPYCCVTQPFAFLPTMSGPHVQASVYSGGSSRNPWTQQSSRKETRGRKGAQPSGSACKCRHALSQRPSLPLSLLL